MVLIHEFEVSQPQPVDMFDIILNLVVNGHTKDVLPLFKSVTIHKHQNKYKYK